MSIDVLALKEGAVEEKGLVSAEESETNGLRVAVRRNGTKVYWCKKIACAAIPKPVP